MFVLTVDQRGSRRADDAVPDLLDDLASARLSGLVRSFERTAGDEVQALLEDPGTVVATAVDLVRREIWSVGIGVGTVERPLPRSVRAGRGSSFVHARAAVERAKSAPHRICVDGDDASGADRAETALWLLVSVLDRRTQAGWDAVDAMARHETQRAAAAALGISAQAMNRRLAVGGWLDERRGRHLAAHLLQEAT